MSAGTPQCVGVARALGGGVFALLGALRMGYRPT